MNWLVMIYYELIMFQSFTTDGVDISFMFRKLLKH